VNVPTDRLDYSNEVRHRFEHAPRHGRLFAKPEELLAGSAGQTEQGVRVEFEARIRQGRIVECRFRAYGCPHVIAAASWVAEQAEGRRVGDTDWLKPRDLAALLEAPAHKLGSLLVVEDALRACLGATGAPR
jgi:NifU-like protein involved in Fe-S cluster formation